MCAPNVTISTTGHPVHPYYRTRGAHFSLPIVIEDNVWIGANVMIMPGVTIGKNSVIGAGSVVTRDIPANVVAFGTPCPGSFVRLRMRTWRRFAWAQQSTKIGIGDVQAPNSVI